MKQISDEICYPLSIIINKSFAEGTVPDNLKLAKVIPVYKSKDSDIFSNYRPIYLLSSVSKILEKVMYKRIYNFLEFNNILYQSQYGFREKHSTTHAILEFISNTVQALDERESTLAVFLDLSKAFDTINHDILLDKLKFYGIRGPVLEWFRSYLDQRKQYVEYLNCNSNTMSITCGVPQGSVLGPLLFLIYMNDLPDCLKSTNSILFADDTSLYKSSKNIVELYDRMNDELLILSDWFRSNKLSLNVGKCNYMLFTNIRNVEDWLELKIGRETIKKSETVKFLGLILDDKLTWNQHIKMCSSKVSGSLYALNRIKHLVSRKYLRSLYFAMIFPHISYGITIWGSTYNIHKRKLIIAQKRAIRCVAGAKYNETTNPLFYQLRLLKLDDLYKMEVAKIIFKYHNNSLPSPLTNLFILKRDINVRSVSSCNDLYPKRCRTTLAMQHIACTGPKIWNALPSDTKKNTSITVKAFSLKLINSFLATYVDNAILQ